MSFSGNVKEELSRQSVKARHCQMAELSAILTMCGGVSISTSDHYLVRVQTENIYVVRKYCSLLRKLLQISPEVRIQKRRHYSSYLAVVTDHEDAVRLLETVHMLPDHMGEADLKKSCCRRAYLRGAFLAAGSVSDPTASYHLEIVCTSPSRAQKLCDLMESFSLNGKIVQRKGHFVVYLKEGAQIVDMLGVIEASNALLELENIRILKEIGNTVNRKVNCETANLNKTVAAALEQIEDIKYLQSTGMLSGLPENLQMTARLRLENPDASLLQLGQMHTPPVGKSGVNHRLKKLQSIAKEKQRT